MKKILFYINAINGGGAERVLVNLAKYFSENEYEVVLLTSFRDSWEYPVEAAVKRLSIEKAEIKQSRIKRNLSRILKFRKICKDEKPDVVVSFMAEPNFRAVIATRGLPLKLLVSVRNDPDREYGGKLGWFVGKILLPLADGCVFQTVDAKKWFPQKLQGKSRIIYNAVKPEFYITERTPQRAEFVTCGRLENQKNHAFLIHAFAEVVKVTPKAVLKIYGEGSLRKQLTDLVESLGLQKNVFLPGASSDVPAILKTASVFVLSSDFEGMPNALMEAMAMGIPCVSTDCPCGGPRELFGEELQNWLVPCGDENAMAEKMLSALEHQEIGQSFAQKAIKFAPEKVHAQWKSYVESL